MTGLTVETVSGAHFGVTVRIDRTGLTVETVWAV